MKYGIYYAYWEQEWAADYKKYVEKVSKLGFDILEVGAAPLPDYTDQEISELRKCAQDNGVILTAGYGPTYELTSAPWNRRYVQALWNGIRDCLR